ncbi:Cif family virulence factor [Granulicella arctica]|uniref:nuclear transport factor 2 family protein n=1 Tax=Granulicella arctica TaxID=940613 RepID=UPI0021E0F649|nr:nuclear transport factor 2 family protein [Granulicella arctica]
MNRFIMSKILACVLLTTALRFAQCQTVTESSKGMPASIASDTVDVQHVIDAYHEAVLSHDGSRLSSLFISQGSMWLNVLSDDTYSRAKAKSPDAQKIRVGSYAEFAKMVSTSKASLNPTHTHLQKNSDGTIASVYFDFIFLIDGKPTNRGSETWVLVKGSEGWRIAAITFSSNPPTS